MPTDTARGLKKILPVVAVVLFPLLLLLFTIHGGRHYALVSLVMVLAALALFFVRYEKKRPPAREWVPLAVMAALAALGRMAFAPLPHAKPMSAVIIITALVFGAEAGFLTGAMAALGSNFFFGQGPWTPWQMFAWGLIGFGAGWLGKRGWLEKKWQCCLYGMASGLLYGWVLNLWSATAITGQDNSGFFALCLFSLPVDLLHGGATVLFLLLIGDSWGAKLRRVQLKFGLRQP